MTNLDRSGIVELLGRLGAENDATVLDAARELHRKMSESGMTWEELLRPDPPAASADVAAERHDESPGDTPADDKLPATGGKRAGADNAEAARLIDRLLARKDLSRTTRDDLADMKRSIADGSFDAMDRNYIRALAKRLGA